MKRIVLLIVAVLFCSVKAQLDSSDRLYSNRYNKLDVDTILSSNRLVTNYVDCLLSRKPCPPEGKDLKRILPEALRTKCARCSQYQREGALKVITKLYYDYPQHYNSLKTKWDPTGEYHRRFEEYLRGLQFNTIDQGVATSSDQDQSIPASSNQNFATSTISSTRQFVYSTDTQRPARNPAIAQNSIGAGVVPTTTPSINVFNRFGGDDDTDASAVNAPAVSTTGRTVSSFTTQRYSTVVTTTTQRPVEAAATVRLYPINQIQYTYQYNTVPRYYEHIYQTQGRPSIVIDKYFIAETPAYRPAQQQNPLIGLINTIGFKLTNTADFFTGMLRGTIQKS